MSPHKRDSLAEGATRPDDFQDFLVARRRNQVQFDQPGIEEIEMLGGIAAMKQDFPLFDGRGGDALRELLEVSRMEAGEQVVACQ